VGFVVDKVALGQVFSEYFGFPCPSSFHQLLHNHHHLSSGAAQAVSRWLPTAAVRGSSPGLVMWDFVMDKIALGQVFSEYFGFPCQSLFHQLLQKSSLFIIWGLYNGPKWPQHLGT
jgi:hypothetical protein